MTVSESEQMYLLTLAVLAEEGMKPPISLAALAQARSIQPVSVNQMVRKLADAGLVTYVPYKGVELTPAGEALARRIIRYRRLWEVFLVEKLALSPAEAESLACRIEHLTSNDVADRLDRYLDGPQISPQGKPIPNGEGPVQAAEELALGQGQFEEPSLVRQIDADAIVTEFLAGEGLRPGAVVRVLGAGAGGTLLITVGERSLRLTAAIASCVRVLPLYRVNQVPSAGQKPQA